MPKAAPSGAFRARQSRRQPLHLQGAAAVLGSGLGGFERIDIAALERKRGEFDRFGKVLWCHLKS